VNLANVTFSSKFREIRSHASNTGRDMHARKKTHTTMISKAYILSLK